MAPAWKWRRRSKKRLKPKKQKVPEAEADGPPNGFEFALPYMDLLSRLNIAKVNKRLREALKDPLVWRRELRVEEPVGRRLTENRLLKLVERADGHLKSLSLVNAYGITDKALKKIIESSPRLERICLPGCIQVTVDNLVSLVEAHSVNASEKGFRGILQIHLRGLRGISREHLSRLRKVLKVPDLPPIEGSLIRRYYGTHHGHNRDLGKSPIDVELCPMCNTVGMVSDCTNTNHGTSEDGLNENQDMEDWWIDPDKCCKGCTVCLPRCEECGRCKFNYWCMFKDKFKDTQVCSTCKISAGSRNSHTCTCHFPNVPGSRHFHFC